VKGHLVIGVGEVAEGICSRSRWADLIVTKISYPPPSQPLARLDSGFRDLILRCPRPVLAVPQNVTPLSHALLAYDGSPKAQEALFVAAYLAGRWKISLVVLCHDSFDLRTIPRRMPADTADARCRPGYRTKWAGR
jgi:hypothetical protein